MNAFLLSCHIIDAELGDDPAIAVFFARPDVLSGLFTLSGYSFRGPRKHVLHPLELGAQ